MTIYIVDLEAVESRYTGQWKTHVPTLLTEKGFDVQVISGPTDIPAATTPGAFLRVWLMKISKMAILPPKRGRALDMNTNIRPCNLK